MTPTRKQLEKQIQENFQLIEKLKTELREVCCYPDSMYSHKIKAEQRYYNSTEPEIIFSVRKLEDSELIHMTTNK
jgi:hypothetical protein